jgi:hypothetical protein
VDEEAVLRYITDGFAGVDILRASGDAYLYYEPDPSVPPDRRFPFATLVTGDRHDQFSDLDRPGVFRLNIGVNKETFAALFGESAEAAHDFTALDRIMPHPVYGNMYWVCVLNPSEATLQKVQPLLAEAHALAVARYARRRAGEDKEPRP